MDPIVILMLAAQNECSYRKCAQCRNKYEQILKDYGLYINENYVRLCRCPKMTLLRRSGFTREDISTKLIRIFDRMINEYDSGISEDELVKLFEEE